MRRSLTTLALALATLLPTAAFAQSSGSYVEPVSFPYAPPEAPHRHSSTAAEGFLRGQAVRIQAEGNFRLLEAQADILRRQSESMSYDNELKKTASALARREMLDDFRHQKRAKKRARRDDNQELRYQHAIATADNYRLDPFQFNRTTGAIYWPTFVASPRYARHRHQLEQLMYEMVHYGAVGDPLVHEEAARLADSFRKQLRHDFQQRSDHTNPAVRQEYLAASRFLLGLKFAPLQANPITG